MQDQQPLAEQGNVNERGTGTEKQLPRAGPREPQRHGPKHERQQLPATVKPLLTLGLPKTPATVKPLLTLELPKRPEIGKPLLTLELPKTPATVRPLLTPEQPPLQLPPQRRQIHQYPQRRHIHQHPRMTYSVCIRPAHLYPRPLPLTPQANGQSPACTRESAPRQPPLPHLRLNRSPANQTPAPRTPHPPTHRLMRLSDCSQHSHRPGQSPRPRTLEKQRLQKLQQMPKKQHCMKSG